MRQACPTEICSLVGANTGPACRSNAKQKSYQVVASCQVSSVLKVKTGYYFVPANKGVRMHVEAGILHMQQIVQYSYSPRSGCKKSRMFLFCVLMHGREQNIFLLVLFKKHS